MAKSTPNSVERSLSSALDSFITRAIEVKTAHTASSQSIRDDDMRSDIAKREHRAELLTRTRSQLDGIKAEQVAYIEWLHTKLEHELRGNQPTDANSVLLRRDATDRARKITSERDALEVLADATRSGDATMAHALGYRARQSGWVDVLDAYKVSQPESADAAAALAVVENLSTDRNFSLSNSMAYSSPLD